MLAAPAEIEDIALMTAEPVFRQFDVEDLG